MNRIRLSSIAALYLYNIRVQLASKMNFRMGHLFVGDSPSGGLRNGVTLSVEAGLIGVVWDGLLFAVGVDVAVCSPDNHHGVGLVLLVKGILQLSGFLAVDAVFGLETGGLVIISTSCIKYTYIFF